LLDFSIEYLLLTIATSAIGMGCFVYGKKQKKAIPLLSGFALCIYPYFFANIPLLILIGIILIILPYFFRF